MKIIDKKTAKNLNMKTFFTGVSCSLGHIEVRSVAKIAKVYLEKRKDRGLT